MEIKRPWIDKLREMGLNECIELGDSPRGSIYTAIFQNKPELNRAGKKFSTQLDKDSGKWYVCRKK